MDFSKLAEAVSGGKYKEAVELVKEGLDEGVDPQTILDEGMLKGMAELGVRFRDGKAFVPEVLMAAKALNDGMELLKDKLSDNPIAAAGKVVIATVYGDLHDIGKNLVKMILETSGFNVIDLGVDVETDVIVEAVREHKPDILALSALLTTTMAYQQKVIEALKAAGLRDSVKVIIGGAPVRQEFCDMIGADGYTKDAPNAGELAKSLLA